DRLDLREDLARLGGDVAKGVKPEDLTAWGSAPPELPTPIRVLARFLTAMSLASILLFLLGISPWPLAGTILSILMFNWRVSGRVGRVVHLSERAERELDILAGVLRRVGTETFETPRLQATRNEMVTAVAGLILWRSHCAFALENWRERWGREVPRWLDAVGEIEA